MNYIIILCLLASVSSQKHKKISLEDIEKDNLKSEKKTINPSKPLTTTEFSLLPHKIISNYVRQQPKQEYVQPQIQYVVQQQHYETTQTVPERYQTVPKQYTSQQYESAPKQYSVQYETAPKQYASQRYETTSKPHTAQEYETAPKQSSAQYESAPKQYSAQYEAAPKQYSIQYETAPKQYASQQYVTSPKQFTSQQYETASVQFSPQQYDTASKQYVTAQQYEVAPKQYVTAQQYEAVPKQQYETAPKQQTTTQQYETASIQYTPQLPVQQYVMTAKYNQPQYQQYENVQYVTDNSIVPQMEYYNPAQFVYLQQYPSSSDVVQSVIDPKAAVQYVMYVPVYTKQESQENVVYAPQYDQSIKTNREPKSLLDSYIPSVLQVQYYKQQQQQAKTNAIQQSLKFSVPVSGKIEYVKIKPQSARVYTKTHTEN